MRARSGKPTGEAAEGDAPPCEELGGAPPRDELACTHAESGAAASAGRSAAADGSSGSGFCVVERCSRSMVGAEGAITPPVRAMVKARVRMMLSCSG